MAGTFRKPTASLIAVLAKAPRRFAFFQIARLLERWHRRSLGDAAADRGARQDSVRFKANPDLAYQATEVSDVELTPGQPASVEVGFMGLAGAGAALPPLYTQLLLQMVRAKSTALRAFLDILNHRSLTLLFGGWAKYRIPIRHEQAQPAGDDPATRLVFALAGLGLPELRRRLAVDDHVAGFFAGNFSRGPRPAEGLQAALESLLDEPVEVRQFQGRWIRLEEGDLTRIRTPLPSSPGFTRLGVDCVLGGQVWDVQGGVRLVIGPVTARSFRELLPDGERARVIVDTARLYAGMQVSFVLQVLTAGDDVPDLRLGAAAPDRPRLGWNTWIGRPVGGTVADAVFAPVPSHLREAR